jgi:uncharacterized protein
MLKWGGGSHWGADVRWLGEDEHGWWAGWPEGTAWSRPGGDFLTFGAQVGLFSRGRGFAATFYQSVPGSGYEFRLYADVTTVPAWEGSALTCVDLDLDVIETFDGRVFVDDEDEFAEHQVRFGYPSAVVAAAQQECARLVGEMRSGAAHFTESLAERWRQELVTLTT